MTRKKAPDGRREPWCPCVSVWIGYMRSATHEAVRSPRRGDPPVSSKESAARVHDDRMAGHTFGCQPRCRGGRLEWAWGGLYIRAPEKPAGRPAPPTLGTA